ncbi:hypothetical protein D3C78_1169170 [compost metagenome]
MEALHGSADQSGGATQQAVDLVVVLDQGQVDTRLRFVVQCLSSHHHARQVVSIDLLRTFGTSQDVQYFSKAFVIAQAQAGGQFAVETGHAGLAQFLDAIDGDRGQVTHHVVQLGRGRVTVSQGLQGRVGVDSRHFTHDHGIRQRRSQASSIDVLLHLSSQILDQRQGFVTGHFMHTGYRQRSQFDDVGFGHTVSVTGGTGLQNRNDVTVLAQRMIDQAVIDGHGQAEQWGVLVREDTQVALVQSLHDRQSGFDGDTVKHSRDPR